MQLKIEVNEPFLQVAESKATYIELIGGRGSGKSHFTGSQYIPIQAIKRPGIKILAGRKVATTIKQSIWPVLLKGIQNYGMYENVSINKTDKTITFKNSSEIFCTGFDDPEKLKSLENVSISWLEEANELTEQDYDNLDAAMKLDFKQIITTHNPFPMMPEFPHWIKTRLLDHADDPNILVIKTTYRDNLNFLPKSYCDNLEKIKERNPKLWDMWANGNFTSLEGAVFDKWDVVDSVPDRARFMGYGLDFGYSSDPCALISLFIRENHLYIREHLYQTGLTNQDLCATFKELGISKQDEIIADCAEPKSIEEIYRAGYNIHPAKKGADSIRNGINKIKEYNIHLLRGSTNLIKEFSSYFWKADKNGKALPVPCDINNHAIDAVRYRISKAPSFIGVGGKNVKR